MSGWRVLLDRVTCVIVPDCVSKLATMTGYARPSSQLMLEIYVRDIRASVAFYEEFGFEIERDGNFVSLRWEETQFFLERIEDAPAPLPYPVGNLRTMVADVDAYWRLALKKGATIIKPIGDRPYGLREFTIAGPDGVGLRFASRLESGRLPRERTSEREHG